MIKIRETLLALVLTALSGPSHAEREVHVVAVGTGHRTADFYALPVARVLVDRPGREVGLVLLDRGTLHWQIETTAGTIITEILRGGPNHADSKITFSGIPMVGAQTSGLPLVFNPWGRDFRTLVDRLADRLGTERLHSFQGAYQSRENALVVDRVDTSTPALAQNYLAHRRGSADDLPPRLRRWLDTGVTIDDVTVAFDETAITLSDPDGTRRFPAPSSVPDILLPVAAVFDRGSRMIYGITYGAEGYIYSVNETNGEWAVVTDLEGHDPASLLYDPDSRQLITTGAFSRPGEIRLFGLDGSRSSTFIPTTAFPGLTDLFDYGNEHGPPLTPRAFSDGWLLLEAREGVVPDAGAYRVYAVRIETSEVRLLRYRNE